MVVMYVEYVLGYRTESRFGLLRSFGDIVGFVGFGIDG
jgi:hypothetical protein